ncbi:hypothetical protein [Roseovarius arcticus]|uniref:hypothetical protein n=1 Tax=Roseovarius arcticus TaxID=2547404 RepID=UPI0011100B66|nr:hypothetical protein [Roseovarius arcticus]
MGHFDKLPDFLLAMALTFSDGLPTDAPVTSSRGMPDEAHQVAAGPASTFASDEADVERNAT